MNVSTPLPAGSKTVHLYRNGFTVDEGKFRGKDDPVNNRFMQDIEGGVAPREFSQSPQGPVHIALVDRRGEDYDAVKHKGKVPSTSSTPLTPSNTPSCNLFAGEGVKLSGGGTKAAGVVNTERATVKICEDMPTTTLQIRYHDGQRTTQKFNQDSTIGDLRGFMQQAAPVSGGNFRILEGFPPKEVSFADSTTLKDAGLLNTAVTQKL
eukprot:GHVR01122107.1.p1 GENE.GHVR01122107.1~~GHVR01122107.1.p1  ORF type:complete len:208 (+),score=36.61 GHVR01122107.1:210-833(+)